MQYTFLNNRPWFANLAARKRTFFNDRDKSTYSRRVYKRGSISKMAEARQWEATSKKYYANFKLE